MALGGAFATVPGFQAKVARSWYHALDDFNADYTLILLQFKSGTQLDTVVASDASARGLTLSTPTQVNGMTTWTASGSERPGTVTRYSYSTSGSHLAFGHCLMTASLQTAGVCSEKNVAALTTAAATRAVPTSIRLSKKAEALIPSTPKGMKGVVLNQQLSSDLFSVANPALTSSPAVARWAAGTLAIELEYSIDSDPGLYVVADLMPLEPAASQAALGTPCKGTTASTCTSAKIRGSGRGYLESFAETVRGTWNGSGRSLYAMCEMASSLPLSKAQVRKCSAAITSLVASARNG